MEQDELKHYGVLGMKWGVRRYTNEDGSLNDAGKKRVQKWKDKEIAKVKTRSEKEAQLYTKSADKYKTKYDELKKAETQSPKKMEKVKDVYGESLYWAIGKKAMGEAEIKKISKMSVKDIDHEISTIGKIKLKSTLFSLAGALGGVIATSPTSTASLKTNLRLTPKEQADILNKSAVKAHKKKNKI